jgi:hypothetical protein
MIQKNPNEITVHKDDLEGLVKECERENPLLARMRATMESLNWSEVNILRYQLLVAVKSNASLQKALKDTELRFGSLDLIRKAG